MRINIDYVGEPEDRANEERIYGIKFEKAKIGYDIIGEPEHLYDFCIWHYDENEQEIKDNHPEIFRV